MPAPINVASAAEKAFRRQANSDDEERTLQRMITSEVREFLDSKRFAVLATINADGSPQQTVMWYELIGDRVMMNTAAGRLKESNMKRDSRISICIEDQYNYVTLTGTVELDYDPERAQADIARLAHRNHPADVATRMETNFRKEERISIWMTVETVVPKI